MSITSLYQKGFVLSLEVFPPKPDQPVRIIENALQGLSACRPDYMSVTYGAGGSSHSGTTDLAKRVRDICHCPPLGHLTCVGSTPQMIDRQLDEFEAAGVDTILALRGDIPAGMPQEDAFVHFRYAAQLIEYIRRRGGFHVAAACYPEGHYSLDSIKQDIGYLKVKVDAGVDFLVTQMFFDNQAFYAYRDKLAAAGVCVPVTAGIMPILDAKQIVRMTTLCGASLPAKMSRLIARYPDPDDFMRAGIDYCCTQLTDLRRHQVDGIHLYTMNKVPHIMQILRQTGLRSMR